MKGKEVSSKELAEIIGLSKRRINQLANENKIPFEIVNGSRVFNTLQILDTMREFERKNFNSKLETHKEEMRTLVKENDLLKESLDQMEQRYLKALKENRESEREISDLKEKLKNSRNRMKKQLEEMDEMYFLQQQPLLRKIQQQQALLQKFDSAQPCSLQERGTDNEGRKKS